MEQALDALLTGAGMLWKALWALIFGYIISAGIQVLVTREQMANVLGERGPTKAGLASFFGFVSSSCSFAALAASRSVLVKEIGRGRVGKECVSTFCYRWLPEQ